ncbi:hypothetical protein [Streptomyces coeruleorubidus]|uniref:hypothetical protein n=1 Tax=Streptomyces coeruleorubidus TaxID=116188 RepID=UPI0033AEF670
MSTPLTTRQPLTAAAVLEATRSVLGSGWMTFPAHNGQIEGTVRSHQGHKVVLRGVTSGNIFAAALLPNGTRQEAAARPQAFTAAGYGSALGALIADELAPAHNAVSPTLRAFRLITGALPHEARSSWEYGAATTVWKLPGGGRGRHYAAPLADFAEGTPGGPGAKSLVRLTGLTEEQAVKVLRALNTDSTDPRRRATAHGWRARKMKAAAPGLRPIDTYNWPRFGGLCTTSLCVDDVVKVSLHYGQRPNVVDLFVTGSMDNQVRAVTAL